MARNKKKSKKPQHASKDDERSETAGSEDESHVDAAQTTDQQAETGEAAATAAVAASDKSSNASDSDDEEAKAAKARRERHIEELRAKRAAKERGKKGKRAEDKPAKNNAKDNKGEGQRENNAEGSDDNDDDGYDGEELVVTRQEPVEVLYCPICTFPAEMCEFSGMMEKCRPWLQEHAKELADAEERGRKRRPLTEKERLEAKLEGRGVKTALQRIVVIETEKGGKFTSTSVVGMDLFGHNLTDLSRDWRKAFACGASVRSAGEGEHQDAICLQGSVESRVADVLLNKYKIPKEALFVVRDRKKERYCP